MEEVLRNIMEKAKSYYENEQEKEYVEIKYENSEQYLVYKFTVKDKLGYLCIFSLNVPSKEEGVIDFEENHDEYPFTDLSLLENKIYKVLDNRLELLKKYEEIKRKRRFVKGVKDGKLDLYGNVVEKEDFKKPTPEQTAWIFKQIRNHFEEGGSYRYLIYNRLGYDESDYQTFYENGGFALSQMANELLDYNEIIKMLFQLQKEGKGVSQEKLDEMLKPLTDLI